jgi:hypothetical protein
LTPEARSRLAERKIIELREKLAGIRAEFKVWLEEAKEGKPLRKHQSQISRLTDQLGGMADGIGKRIDELSVDQDEILAECQKLQAEMLEVHRLWDYFRSKLSLRYVSWFNRYLAAADEFAWACYEPPQRAAKAEDTVSLRGMPLVFLSGGFSPFTYTRRTAFEVEEVPEARHSPQFLRFVRALPIPVIGVPWYQVSHLPDAPIIAHEVAHDVEQDYGLTTTIKAHLEPALAGMDPDRQYAWKTWLGEVWADLYAVLVAGPAFVSAMADLLVTDPVQIATGARAPSPWDEHPPASLRVRLMTLALTKTGFSTHGTEYWNEWCTSFEAEATDSVFEAAPEVLQALLSGKYPELGGHTLPELLRFSGAQQEAAEAVKRAVLDDLRPASGDIRCLVAGARLAFDCDPEGYVREGDGVISAGERILTRALSVIGNAPRITSAEEGVTPEDDRKAGEALLACLQKFAGGSE